MVQEISEKPQELKDLERLLGLETHLLTAWPTLQDLEVLYLVYLLSCYP